MPASCVRWFAGFAPRIWAVEAVGMGATSSELRTPCCAICARSAAQSQRSVVLTLAQKEKRGIVSISRRLDVMDFQGPKDTKRGGWVRQLRD